MSNLINKIKEKTTGPSHNEHRDSEPTYSIQPHPARSEDPRDLEPPQLGGGLNSNPEYNAFHAKGPYVPTQEVLNNVQGPAAGRDELSARQADLNRK
ncbi:hypothetical protein BXZ70DRAFT_728138 [Cristinia sonorae]|uniref:Uncharacterized protein n=1 Tax=Cristinia sonorae TaxID=1940300 RepID=A0A8K0UVC7_9AGAR|nr:hypothetical protein BXZ70DRAFT_728138 [Cristinia sonorae]